jgi:hypothetical protein
VPCQAGTTGIPASTWTERPKNDDSRRLFDDARQHPAPEKPYGSPFRSPAVGSAKPNPSFANSISCFSLDDFVGIRQTWVRLFVVHLERGGLSSLTRSRVHTQVVTQASEIVAIANTADVEHSEFKEAVGGMRHAT